MPVLRLKIAGLVASTVLLAGCVSIGRLNPERGVVLPKEAGPDALQQCSRRSPTNVAAFWVPSADDIARLEARLPGYLRSRWHAANVPHSSPLSELPPLRLERYYRQYLGVLVHGRKLIYINAFSPEYLEDPSPWWFARWREEAIIVCDGAFALWGAEYDTEAREFRNLQFHPWV